MVEVKAEVKMEPVEPHYPNYMESIESVINASTKIKKPKQAPAPVKAAMSNQLPYHDHQYSRVTFYGSGMDTIGMKAQENAAKEEKVPAQPKTKAPKPKPKPKQKVAKVQAVKKPRQKSRSRAKPISYRFKPNNGLQQSAPVYFVPATSATYTDTQHTPPVVRSMPQANAGPCRISNWNSASAIPSARYVCTRTRDSATNLLSTL